MTVTIQPSQIGRAVALDMGEVAPHQGTVYLTHTETEAEAQAVASYVRRLLDPEDPDSTMGRYLVEAWTAVRS